MWNDPASPDENRSRAEYDQGADGTGDNSLYIVWDDPAIADEDMNRREPEWSDWGRQTSNYDGTRSGGTTATPAACPFMFGNIGTETTEVTVPNEVPSVTAFDARLRKMRIPVQRRAGSSLDDKETLREIIRAYAGPHALLRSRQKRAPSRLQ